jgi:multidrug efflux pump subunit AcrB
VSTVNGTVIRLSNIASIRPSVRNSRAAGWFNRDPSVLLIITKQADANVIDTVDRIYSLLPELRQWVPAGLEISVLSDRTQTIRASVRDMQLTLAATVVLVMLVVFLFLRRAAPTAAAGVTVPLALSGTCAAMWAAGFSIDNLSLMALAVSVGFVVDDAIVMIENAFRHLEKGAFAPAGHITGRETDRLHRRCHFRLSCSRVHPAPVHGRTCRTTVSRIFGHARFRNRHFHGRVAVGHADDLRLFRAPAAEPRCHVA